MPFQTTATPPAMRSKVTLEFAGQLLLEAGADDTNQSHTCEIGVNRFTLAHMLQVLLIVSKPNRAPIAFPLLRGPLTSDFTVRLDPDGFGDFHAFAPTPEPFLRTAAANNHENDYRWAMNVRALHPIAKRNRGAEPVVKVRTGTLYAPDVTHPDLAPRFERTNLPPIPLYRVAADLAVSIDPPAGKTVRLEWQEMGDPFHIDLPRQSDSNDAGTIYTVSFINDPPMSEPLHDELGLFYKCLHENGSTIPQEARWSLTYNDQAKSDEIPCLPGVLNP